MGSPSILHRQARIMRIHRAIMMTLAAAVVLGCGGETGSTSPTPPVPPTPTVLLKDVEITRLPSPYYHFEYDTTGRLTLASFASELTRYNVVYDGGRIHELDNTAGNRDRLEYTYDDAGRVGLIKYIDASGQVFTVVFFTYDGSKLVKLERNRRVPSGFIFDKEMSFSYYPDGNVRDITEHHPAFDGPAETTTVDHYERYDDRINVDDFDLLHTEFFDHLLLLPGVRLQKGNPGRVTHTGDGDNYTVDYAYTYDDAGRPLTKSGELVFLTGPDTGKKFQTHSQFSYY
jgi:hypothetical protein